MDIEKYINVILENKRLGVKFNNRADFDQFILVVADLFLAFGRTDLAEWCECLYCECESIDTFELVKTIINMGYDIGEFWT